MNRKARTRIFWLNDRGDLERLPDWLQWRAKHVTAAIEREHDDSGAISICLFKHEDEAGLIRCANEELAEIARDTVEEVLQMDVASDMGGDAPARKRTRKPAPRSARGW